MIKLRLTVLIAIALLSQLAGADILLIVNAKNSLNQLEKKQVVDLYMGRVSVFPNQQPAQIFDMREGSALRENFYKLLTGKSEAQIDAYWATLLFAGKMSPPKQISREQDVIDIIKNNPAGIAYVRKQNLPPGLKVVLEITDSHVQ